MKYKVGDVVMLINHPSTGKRVGVIREIMEDGRYDVYMEVRPHNPDALRTPIGYISEEDLKITTPSVVKEHPNGVRYLSRSDDGVTF